MNAWYIHSEERPEGAEEGHRIIYVLMVDDVEMVFDQLADDAGLESNYDDLNESQRNQCVQQSVRAFEDFDFMGPIQDAVGEIFEQVKRAEEEEEDEDA